MTFRIARTRAVDTEELHLHAESHGRRWDDPQPPARPTKFTQRLAVVLGRWRSSPRVLALVVLCGGHA